MGLPTISTPKYEAKIPSTGQTIEFRPFLVKEEKILLIALESKDKKAQNKALKQILKNCIQSPVNINSLAVFDIEYLFIQIRGKSVGEVLEPIVVCPECSISGKIKINLNEIEVDKRNTKETPHKIMLTKSVGMTMVYPNMEMVEDMDADKAVTENDTESLFKIIVRCIDMIFDEEKTYNVKEYSEKELIQFIENASTESFRKILEFISSMPRVQKEVKFKCPGCGCEKDMVLRGVEDFFGSVSPTTA